MFVKFFDTPNDMYVAEASKVFDTIELHNLLLSLPEAMITILENAPKPISDDPDLDEPRRQHLNRVISLSSLLLDITELYTNPNIRMLDRTPTNREALLRAAHALRLLQVAKEARIAEIHKINGENFGSATGFQKHNYHDDADKIMALDWIKT